MDNLRDKYSLENMRNKYSPDNDAERKRKEEEELKRQQDIIRQQEENRRNARKQQELNAKTKAISDITRDKESMQPKPIQEPVDYKSFTKSINQNTYKYLNENKIKALQPHLEYSQGLSKDLFDTVAMSNAAGKPIKEEDLIPEYDNEVDIKLNNIKSKIKPGTENTGDSIKEGALEREVMDMLSKENYRKMFGKSNNVDKINKFIESNPELFASEEGSKSFRNRTARGTTDVALQQVQSLKHSLPTVATYTALGATMGAAFSIPTLGAAAPITSTVGALMGFKYGMRAGSFLHMYEVEAGLAYSNMLEEGIPHEIAKPIAIGIGAINGIIETVQLDGVINNIPGMDAIIQKIKKEGLDASLNTIKKLGLKYTTDLAKNIGEELAQENVGMLGKEIAKVYQGEQDPNILGGFKNYKDKIGSPEWRNVMRDTAIGTAESMWLLPIASGAGGVAVKTGLRTVDQKLYNKKKDNLLYTQMPDLIKNAEKDIINDDDAIKQFTALNISIEEALRKEDVSNKDKEQLNNLKEQLDTTVTKLEYEAKTMDGEMEFLAANEIDVESMFLEDDFNVEELELYNKGVNELTVETYKKAKDLGILENIRTKIIADENRAAIANEILSSLPKKERTIINAKVMVDEVEKMMGEIKTQVIMNRYYNIVMAKETIITNKPSEVDAEVQTDTTESTQSGSSEDIQASGQVEEQNQAEGQIEPLNNIEAETIETEAETLEIDTETVEVDTEIGEEENDTKSADIEEIVKEFKQSNIVKTPVNKMILDPVRFQFRYEQGSDGTTTRLEGTEWNTDIADADNVLLWQDELNDLYMVNGHYRLGLALANGVTELNAKIISYKDMNAEEARAVGAMINIAQGHATSIDVAKVIKETGFTLKEMEKQGVPPKSKIARDGHALSQLEDWIFTQVATRAFPLERAIIIGKEFGDDKPAQRQMIRELSTMEAKGKTVTNDILSEMVAQAKGMVQASFTEQTLFGEEYFTKDLAVERAEVVTFVKGQLKDRVSILKNVSKEKNASLLSELGNKIAIDDNTKEMTIAEQALYVLDKTLNYQGTKTNEIFNRYATEYANAEPKDRSKIKKAALNEYIKAMEGGNLFNETGTKKQRQSAKEILTMDKGTRRRWGTRNWVI